MSESVTQYVICNRITGGYSERFDTREDAERALRFFAPFTSAFTPLKRYDILECKLTGNQWFILDPECPKDAIYVVFP